MPSITLPDQDIHRLLDALHYASDEVGYDLYDTRNSDFYDSDDRRLREEKIDGWMRLVELLTPLTREDDNAND